MLFSRKLEWMLGRVHLRALTFFYFPSLGHGSLEENDWLTPSARKGQPDLHLSWRRMFFSRQLEWMLRRAHLRALTFLLSITGSWFNGGK